MPDAGGHVRSRLSLPPIQLVRQRRSTMLAHYDVVDCSDGHGTPQSALEKVEAVSPADALDNLAHCQQLLVRAKTQRTMYPLDSYIGDTKATDVAKAELRLAHAYRKVGSLDQVRILLRTLDHCRLYCEVSACISASPTSSSDVRLDLV